MLKDLIFYINLLSDISIMFSQQESISYKNNELSNIKIVLPELEEFSVILVIIG